MRKTKLGQRTLFVLFAITMVFVSRSFAGSDYKSIDTAQLHSMVIDNAYRLEAGRKTQFMIIDARTIEEYDKAHIFSAVSIPEKDFEQLMVLLPKDKSVQLAVYCDDIKF